MSLVFNMLAWSYPLALHLCIYLGRYEIAAFYLALLLAWPLAARLIGLQRPGWFELLGALLAAALITVLGTHELVVFKLLPVLVNGALFVLFGASLRRGVTPVITRLAIMMKTSVSAAELAYTRSITIFWAAVFLFMGTMSAILAVYAGTELWSWFANVISYVIVVGVFLAEFMVRRRVLVSEADYSLAVFLKNLARINLRRAILQTGTAHGTLPPAPETLETHTD